MNSVKIAIVDFWNVSKNGDTNGEFALTYSDAVMARLRATFPKWKLEYDLREGSSPAKVAVYGFDGEGDDDEATCLSARECLSAAWEETCENA